MNKLGIQILRAVRLRVQGLDCFVIPFVSLDYHNTLDLVSDNLILDVDELDCIATATLVRTQLV